MQSGQSYGHWVLAMTSGQAPGLEFMYYVYYFNCNLVRTKEQKIDHSTLHLDQFYALALLGMLAESLDPTESQTQTETEMSQHTTTLNASQGI